jgi:tetratricopeptide (TPR) repeat protein
MAPEQLLVLAEKHTAPPADWRPADVFGCGVILYELLTGQHPFGTREILSGLAACPEPAAELLRLQASNRANVARLNPRVKPALRTLIERCLAQDPNVRPTAAELAAHFAPSKPARSRRRLALVPLLFAVIATLSWGTLSRQQTIDQDQSPPPLFTAPVTAFDRGLLFLEQGQHGMAAVEFLAAGRADADGRAYAFAAYCLSVRKDSKGASTAADEAIRLGYRKAPVFANRAYNRLLANRLTEALEDCNEALRLDPELRAARLTRAFVHLQLHLQKGVQVPPSSIGDIERVLAGVPNTADVWLTAAQLYVFAPGSDPDWREKAARAVREAVLAGKSPDAIRRNPFLKSTLAGHPLYEEALGLKPGPVDPSINPQLCRPHP